MKAKMVPAILGLAISGLLTAGNAQAQHEAVKVLPLTFDATTTEGTLKITAESFYNPTMGYEGWAMFSGWVNVKLKKGNLYTVTVIADPSLGIHPGAAIYYRPQGSGLVPNNWVYDHYYQPWGNVIDKNVLYKDEKEKVKSGAFKQLALINGFDRDGMYNPLPEEFDQGLITRILDGTPGKVTIQYLAKDTGWHQIAVGALNPDAGVDLKVKFDVGVAINGL
jgi:hypothetical protein